MRPIRTTKLFDKSYSKRIGIDHKLRQRYIERVKLFQSGHTGYPLNDHQLGGKLVGKRSFSVANNIRVIYIEADAEIIFLDIGSHNQVY